MRTGFEGRNGGGEELQREKNPIEKETIFWYAHTCIRKPRLGLRIMSTPPVKLKVLDKAEPLMQMLSTTPMSSTTSIAKEKKILL